MPFTSTFKVATDEDLTLEFSGTFNPRQRSDFTDDPFEATLYIGSLSTVTTTLKAASNPGVDNIVVSVADNLPIWTAATTYAIGYASQPTVANGKRYVVSVAGQSHASVEPTWPTTPVGATVTDGTVTWQLVGPKHSVNEVKLANTEGGLATATPGASLSLGTSITSGAVNAKPIWIELTNGVSTLGSDAVNPDISLQLNAVQEFG